MTWADGITWVALAIVMLLLITVLGAVEKVRKTVAAVARRQELHEQISQGEHAAQLERGAVGDNTPPRADA